MVLDEDTCYRAARSRDARFDGRFFTAVKNRPSKRASRLLAAR